MRGVRGQELACAALLDKRAILPFADWTFCRPGRMM